MKFSALTGALRKKGVDFTLHFDPTLPENEADPVVSEVFADSRRVAPESVFCCVTGEHDDGHRYASAAQAAGAVALVCEYLVETTLPVILVKSVRDTMGELSGLIYGSPCEKLFMVGVTGTNGKSTTAWILRSILEAAGIRTGLLGSIVENDGIREREAERTTPESCDIQRQLAVMVKNGCGACVMETSSHGLSLGRLGGCRFDAGIFTNLNPEHLDFHKDMESYFQAKRLLFTRYMKETPVVAVNADDPWGRRLLEEFPQTARSFGMADVSNVRLDMEGSSFAIKAEGLPRLKITSPLVGSFNVANALAAVTALRGRVSDDAILEGTANIPQVPGRLEKHELSNGARCIIDFAHTPEALRNVLSVVRGFCSGKLISIFGHGGGRYPSNRPALGAVAASLADLVIVTMDNPRDEDPLEIAGSIVSGIVKEGGGTRYQVIPDRREAVFTGLSVAGPGDVLVVSGKGPEKYLLIRDRKIPYSDAGTLEEWERLANSR